MERNLSQEHKGLKNDILGTKTILGISEAAAFTGLSKSALYKKTMAREIPFYKPGGKLIYFQLIDLEEFMLSNLQKSKSQLAREAEEFLSNAKKQDQK